MAYRGSEAYDFSLFEPQVIQQPKQQPRKANNAKSADLSRKGSAQKSNAVKKTAPKSNAVKNTAPKSNVVKKTNSGSTAPKKAPAPKTAPNRKPLVSLMDSYGLEVERNAQTLAVPSSVKKFFCFAVVCTFLLVVLLVMNARCDVLMSEIADIENQIEIAEGENVRLNAELSSKISTDKIDEYAVDVLGMVKAENYQIYYVDLSEGDEIVLSGEKTTQEEPEVTNKIKELFAYIF